jgi:hypothetical protein
VENIAAKASLSAARLTASGIQDILKTIRQGARPKRQKVRYWRLEMDSRNYFVLSFMPVVAGIQQTRGSYGREALIRPGLQARRIQLALHPTTAPGAELSKLATSSLLWKKTAASGRVRNRRLQQYLFTLSLSTAHQEAVQREFA